MHADFLGTDINSGPNMQHDAAFAFLLQTDVGRRLEHVQSCWIWRLNLAKAFSTIAVLGAFTVA